MRLDFKIDLKFEVDKTFPGQPDQYLALCLTLYCIDPLGCEMLHRHEKRTDSQHYKLTVMTKASLSRVDMLKKC
jgi:hypothetical protein